MLEELLENKFNINNILEIVKKYHNKEQIKKFLLESNFYDLNNYKELEIYISLDKHFDYKYTILMEHMCKEAFGQEFSFVNKENILFDDFIEKFGKKVNDNTLYDKYERLFEPYNPYYCLIYSDIRKKLDYC